MFVYYCKLTRNTLNISLRIKKPLPWMAQRRMQQGRSRRFGSLKGSNDTMFWISIYDVYILIFVLQTNRRITRIMKVLIFFIKDLINYILIYNYYFATVTNIHINATVILF